VVVVRGGVGVAVAGRGDDGEWWLCVGGDAAETAEGGERRVEESEYDDRIDRAKRSTFGFGWNARRKTFPAAATWWPAAAGRKGEAARI
ncbi:hypothetical protein Tco_0415695, partial [Tanacetum coccineum]